MHFPSSRSVFIFIVSIAAVVYACGKGGGSEPPPNPCAGVTIVVSGTVTQPTVAGNNGGISASATGGTGMTYSINGGAYQSSGNFTGLAAGSYTITAKDSRGCTGAASFTLTTPNPCAGVTITVTATTVNPTAQAATNGSISATAAGSSGFTYNINGGAFQASGNFTNLAAGSYTISAKDANGCTGSAVFTLTAPNPCAGVTITVSGTTVNPTAAGATNGSINATASGSTGFSYSLNGGAFQASGNFTGLGAGTYTVTARDGNACTGSAVFTLTAPNPCAGVTITVTPAVTDNTPCLAPNGSISAAASGGTGPYTFSLNGGAFQSSNIFSGLTPATYTLAARDVNACNGSTSATVNNLPAGPLFQEVRTILQNNCVPCHNNAIANGGMNWTVDCNIVNNKDRIQARAVNGTGGPMPPTGLLPLSERQKIINWINAGGRFTD